MSASTRPSILVQVAPTMYDQLFFPEVDARLRALGDVTFQEDDARWTSDRLAAGIGGHDAIVTCWGTPRFTAEVLAAASDLKIVAHAAGSVKFFLGEDVLRAGIRVTSASAAMAPAVAEFALLQVMLGLRAPHLLDRHWRVEGNPWPARDMFGEGREIAGSRIGVVGCGLVGTLFVEKAVALGAEVWVYDPYLAPERAQALGVHVVGLDELFAACPIIVIHAASTPETHHMIGARQLALMPENALLVNTARSWVVDQDALYDALAGGRIRAALDVFDVEPLPRDDRFLTLPNVLLTPHVAGATLHTRYRQGESAVQNLEQFFAGKPLVHEVTLDRYPVLA